MRIDKLTLTNFRCFEEITINLHKRVNLFVGVNGSGKSSLLDAIRLSAGAFLFGIDGVSGSSIKKTDARTICHEIGSVLDLESQFPVGIEASGMIGEKAVHWKISLNSEKGKTSTINAKEILSEAKRIHKGVREGDTSLVLPIISYYGTGRLWAKKHEKRNKNLVKLNRIKGYVDALDAESNEKLMLHWFQNMTLAEAQTGKAIPEYSAVKNAISKCFEGISGHVDTKASFNLYTHEIDMEYTDENGERQRVPMSDLSDGYKNTISMISDIAYRMALLNPQLLGEVLQTPGIIIIDEIDLHLHPTWQQRIINDLCSIFPNVQFMLSSHAPSVINSIDKDNLIILKDNQVIPTVYQTYGRDSNSILREVMNANVRPQEIELKFKEFYNAMDNNNFSNARMLLAELEEKPGINDPEVTSCRVALELNEI